MRQFVHLHVHSEYSLLDGAVRLEALLDKCKQLNMPAVAITDHGNMYCAWKFFHTFKDSGVKPIIGCEFYMCEDRKQRGGEYREYFHLVLLAKNNIGYRNLVKLNSIAFLEGYYYKPRIDWDTLKQHSEGLICLSACIAGQLPRLLLSDRKREAYALAEQYKELFGDDYYIEIQDHGIYEERMVLPQLIDLANQLDIKLVATNDVHYLNRDDAEAHDIMLCVQTKRVYSDPNRMRFEGDSFFLKNYDEMEELFPDMQQALENTLEIAQKCNVMLEHEKLLPSYIPEDGSDHVVFFRKIIEEGIVKRYPVCTQEIRDRIEYEFNTIVEMGFVDYYLIVWDFINYAKTNGIPVGPGRGSGAGSVIAYVIAITDVEPFKYNLLFERFLNPQRKTMPDFDIDFCMDRRGEVIDYVQKKYGEGKVSQIVTFGTMAAKNAIRDVCRAMSISTSEANRLAKYVPDMFKYSLAHLLGKKPYPKAEDTVISQELIEAYNNPATHKVIDIAMRIEGSPRQTGMHAAGVVICSEPIADHVPLQTNGGSVDNGGIITTQYNMVEVEQAGLLKMDFLGLRTLTDIKKAIDFVKEQEGVDISFDNCQYDDKNVFDTISSGDTMCIFQLESGGMSDLMKRMKPDSLEDIIAGISLYRPGPMQFIDKYIAGKFDKSTIAYSHPLMEQILSLTNGCIVYQEQVMQIVKLLAGFSTALADNVRYAMSKKKLGMMEELGKLFVKGGVSSSGEQVQGCINNGISEKVANGIYKELIDFSQYAFNKSHATAYAYVTYQTAYLKHYYPRQLICAMLNNRISNITDIKKYINYAMSIGIEILPPCINRSKAGFTVEGNAIRFGLGAIKNIGVVIVDKIVTERNNNGEFESLVNLFERTATILNKALIENLIKGGAFDCFGRTRADMLQKYDMVLTSVMEIAKKKLSGQTSIFDTFNDDNFDTYSNSPVIAEYSKEILYSNEKEVLGLYMSGSPLDDYDKYNKMYKFDFDTSMLPQVSDEEDEGVVFAMATNKLERRKCTAGGILHDLRVMTGKDNNKMAFGVLEDKFDTIEVAMYGRSYEDNKALFAEDAFLIVKGTITESRDSYKINISKLINPKSDKELIAQNELEETTVTTLWIKLASKDADLFDKATAIIQQYEGNCSVMALIEGKPYALKSKVRQCNGVEYELAQLLGASNVKFVTKTK